MTTWVVRWRQCAWHPITRMPSYRLLSWCTSSLVAGVEDRCLSRPHTMGVPYYDLSNAYDVPLFCYFWIIIIISFFVHFFLLLVSSSVSSEFSVFIWFLVKLNISSCSFYLFASFHGNIFANLEILPDHSSFWLKVTSS